MKINTRWGLIVLIVIIYGVTFGLVIPGFVDEAGLAAILYYTIGRG